MKIENERAALKKIQWSRPGQRETSYALRKNGRGVEYVDKLSALHQHASQLGLAKTIDEITEHTLDAMKFALGFDWAGFFRVEDGYLKFTAIRGAPVAFSGLPLDGSGITAKAANTKSTIRVPDVRKDSAYVDGKGLDWKGPPTMLSELAVPVVVDDEVAAVLNAESSKLDAFTGEDQTLLEILAFHVGSALKRLADVAERRRVEEALKESEERYRLLIERQGGGLAIVDLEERFTYCNPVAEEIFKLPGGTLVGRSLQEFTSPEAFRFLKEQIGKRLIGEKDTYELEITCPDGEKRQLLVTAAPWLNKYGVLVGSTAMFRDISERKRMEEALANERNVLRTLIDNLPDNIFIKDAESRFVTGNLAHARLLRAKTPDEIVGKTDFDIFPHELAASYYADEQAVIRSGEPLLNREERTIDPNGKTRWLLTTKVPLRGEHGKVIGIAGINRDITERKRAEEALRESEEKYRRLFEQAMDGIALADAETGILLDCNQALAALVDRKRAELIGQHQAILHPPAGDGSAFSPTFRLHATTREGQLLETQVITSTGQIREVEIKANVLYLQGRRTLQGIFHDITERKRMEEKLRQSEDRFRGIAERSFDLIFTTDREGRITYVSPAVERILGYKPEEVVGQSIQNYLPESEVPKAFQTLGEALQGKVPEYLEFEVRRKDGPLASTWISASPIVRDGVVIGAQAILRDITERKRAEEALANERNLLRTLIDNLPDNIFIKDAESRFVTTNLVHVRHLRAKTLDEIIGKTDFDIYPRELAASYYADEQAVIGSGQPLINREERTIDPEGKTRWYLTTKVPLRDDHGKIVGIVGVNRDITERKMMEDELRESQAEYKSLFEDSPMPLWLQDQSEVKKSLDRLKNSGISDFEAYFQSHPEVVKELLDKVKILDVNQATSRLYEAPNREVYQEGLARLFAEESFDSFRRQLVQMARGSTTFRSEYTTLTFSGDKKRITLTWSVAPGYEESLSRVFVSTIDITDRKRMEDELRRYSTRLEQLVAERTGALQESEKKYRQLIETAQEGLFTYDTNGVVTFVNPFMSIMLGYAPEEMIGKNLLAFVDEEYVGRVKAGMQRRRLGVAETYEARLIRKEGSRIHVNATASSMIDKDGRFAGGLALLSDITERKRLEAQLVESERLAAVGEAAAMVGHDLRNPLQAMTGTIYVAKELATSENVEDRKRTMELLGTLDDEIQYMDKIVSDLQDYARPVGAELVETSPPDLIKATVSGVRIPKNVEVAVNVGDGLSNVKLDPALFRRVLTNLILNAVQAMPKGGRLTITGSREDDSLTVAVQDTGVGIAPENLEKVFTPFFTTKAKGQGLGLAVCKRLTEAQGGTITVKSKIAEGSSFTLKIPTNRTPAAT
jgi:PAS domain S-box-containing protein